MNSGSIYVDPITSQQILGMAVGDYVATQNGLVGANPLTNATVNLSASGLASGNEFRISFFAFLNANMTGSGTESAMLTCILDNGNNFANNDTRISSHIIGLLPSPYRNPYGNAAYEIVVTSSSVAGEMIFKLGNPSGGVDSDSNVINNSATASDAFYLKIVIS